MGHRGAIGQDGLQREHAKDAGLQQRRVQRDAAHAPAERVGGQRMSGHQGIDTCFGLLEMLRREQHAFVPNDAVGHVGHALPPSMLCVFTSDSFKLPPSRP